MMKIRSFQIYYSFSKKTNCLSARDRQFQDIFIFQTVVHSPFAGIRPFADILRHTCGGEGSHDDDMGNHDDDGGDENKGHIQCAAVRPLLPDNLYETALPSFQGSQFVSVRPSFQDSQFAGRPSSQDSRHAFEDNQLHRVQYIVFYPKKSLLPTCYHSVCPHAKRGLDRNLSFLKIFDRFFSILLFCSTSFHPVLFSVQVLFYY
jgi:hypothetical protein